MATAKIPKKTILFLGVMYRDTTQRDAALEQFCSQYGATVMQTGPHSFSEFSEYYNKEMGGEVFKEYYFFEIAFDRDELANVKIFTNEIEHTFEKGSMRPINLDPGYLTADKFVLASAKDFAHRIHVGKGIYAEVTLHFHQGKVKFFSWTYRDYLQEPVEKFLLEGRRLLLR